MFDISWSPESLKQIAEFAGVGILLDKNVQEAMKEGADAITQSAQANTWERFQNPTGALAESIGVVVDTPYEIVIGSNLPYAARREWGFSGMTDSLGRFFPHDPGVFYLGDAMAENQEQVMELLQAAVMKALPGGS